MRFPGRLVCSERLNPRALTSPQVMLVVLLVSELLLRKRGFQVEAACTMADLDFTPWFFQQ